MTQHGPITPPVEELLRRQLATGQFESATDVLAAALRQLEERPSVAPASAGAFGMWAGRYADGLDYQASLRSEWRR